MSCGLFVAEVLGSSTCAVCRRNISEHDPTAIYVEPRKIFANLPPAPESNGMSSLATSENSAFSPYARPIVRPGSSPSCSNRSQHPLVKPKPRLAAPCTVSQEDRSDSCIYKKIHGKRKERSNSVGELRVDNCDLEELTRSSQRSSPLPTDRSTDFKKILQRFQSAEQPEPQRRRTVNCNKSSTPDSEMSPGVPRELWSPNQRARDGWPPLRASSVARDSWSPARSISNSASVSSPNSRNTSARSGVSMTSLQSPIPSSFLPTRDCSPRSMPSPSLIPLRASYSDFDNIEVNPLSRHSPLSHTGSTPEPVPTPVKGIPPTPKRRSLPGRWIKETDIDEGLSPLGSASVEGFSQENVIQSEQYGPKKSDDGAASEIIVKPTRSFGGSCRKVLSGLDHNRNSPNGVYVRRSRSKDDRPHTAQSMGPKSINSSVGSISRATLHNIPIFLSAESVRDSPSISPSRKEDKESYKIYQQVALSHVQTLSSVADRIADDLRRPDEPVDPDTLNMIDFRHFVVQTHPVLTKGKSLFYNGVLPRMRQSDYQVTIMIAPCSQYAPLMRRNDSQIFSLPGFVEMEDHDGSIRRFLETTGTHNLDGRNTKAVVMPRLNLCSFHSLAAHYLTEQTDRAWHEQLVSFILLQLLSALKMLQSEGVEALSANFKEFLLAYRHHSKIAQANLKEFPRLIFLPETFGAEVESGGDEQVGLCRYALRALCTLLHHKMDGKPPPIRAQSRYSRPLQACANILAEDKSSSLTKAKNVLELSLWWNGSVPRFESECRQSLDFARAECVNSMLRQLVMEPSSRLGAREHLRIEFLLGATPRSIIDSSATINATKIY